MMKKLTIMLIFLSSTLASTDLIKARLKNFRDPFKKNVISRTKMSKNKKKIQTFFSNRINPAGVSLEELKVVGIFLGRQRRAIGKRTGSSDTFIIKEGMKIGPDKAEVKAIMPGGVVLVEEIVNVYDEKEFLETVIPVTE